MRWVALLRAVNVGGTGKLPMAELKAMAEALGLADVKTYIASGNLVFSSDRSAADIRAGLEGKLEAYAGKPVGVILRTGADMARLRDANPFPDAPGNRVVAILMNDPTGPDAMDGIKGQANEIVCPGEREIYVHYPDGQADTKLVIPSAKSGTARNMNTIAKLAAMAAG